MVRQGWCSACPSPSSVGVMVGLGIDIVQWVCRAGAGAGQARRATARPMWPATTTECDWMLMDVASRSQHRCWQAHASRPDLMPSLRSTPHADWQLLLVALAQGVLHITDSWLFPPYAYLRPGWADIPPPPMSLPGPPPPNNLLEQIRQEPRLAKLLQVIVDNGLEELVAKHNGSMFAPLDAVRPSLPPMRSKYAAWPSHAAHARSRYCRSLQATPLAI